MTSVAKIPELTREALLRENYALWANDYDETPNPLLSLEERFLAPILPELNNADVVDVGCGTGRWLHRIAGFGARSLMGVDFSSEMLDRARRKLGPKALLALGDATLLPMANHSADIVLTSFVASYVSDLVAFGSELRRIIRPAGRIYIADVHPETELSCHWRRGFRAGNARVRMSTVRRSLKDITAHLADAGLQVLSLLEPGFGLPELETFRMAGKLDAFNAAAELPAIYILELQAREPRSTVSVLNETQQLLVRGSRIALDGDTSVASDVKLFGATIGAVRSTNLEAADGERAVAVLDLRGYLLLPGLINAHDHLEFGLYPNLGRPPYRNFVDWASDIQERDADLITAHQSIPLDVRLWWGAIRNLLSGVTTVCHHNPYHAVFLSDEFPLRVIKGCNWAHSLAIEPELADDPRFRTSSAPFVIHAAEGVDESAENEIFTLDRLGVLNEHTVLVHGLALQADGIELLNRRKAVLVWCPTSNQFLFRRTHDREAIASTQNVLLGSDSPLTAAGDLLDELRIANRNVGVSAADLYRMVFEAPADVFRLADGEGRIRAGGAADFIAVRDSGLAPSQALTSLTFRNVELVVVQGRVQVASDRIFRRLPSELAAGLRPLDVEGELRWVRAPLGRLFQQAERILGCVIKIGGKRVRHVCTSWL